MKKGEAKKRLRRNKGRHSKISKNSLFRGKKQVFLLKQRKEKTNKKTKKTHTKEGLEPSEVALWATSPDP